MTGEKTHEGKRNKRKKNASRLNSFIQFGFDLPNEALASFGYAIG
jgi:hypothetical protein